MKKIFAILVIVVCNVIGIQGQETVDTNVKYKVAKEARDTKDDCAVRAIAETYNIPYGEAYRIIEEWGRKDNKKGILQTDFLNGLADDYMDTVVSSGKNDRGTYPIFFIEGVAKEGSTYLVMSHTHIFVIEQDEAGDWTIYGNSMDLFEKIYSFIEIKVPTAKAKGLTYKTTI
jgi:hypothetical protein